MTAARKRMWQERRVAAAARCGSLICPVCNERTEFSEREDGYQQWLVCDVNGCQTDLLEVTAANTPLVDRPAGMEAKESEAIQ